MGLIHETQAEQMSLQTIYKTGLKLIVYIFTGSTIK